MYRVLTNDGEVDDGVLCGGEEEVDPAAVGGLVAVLDGEELQVGPWGGGAAVGVSLMEPEVRPPPQQVFVRPVLPVLDGAAAGVEAACRGREGDVSGRRS